MTRTKGPKRGMGRRRPSMSRTEKKPSYSMLDLSSRERNLEMIQCN